jgi:hypothetical protein
MNPGYYSDEAVKDLLAVKDGEIDFLKKQIESLTSHCNYLSDKVNKLTLNKCDCS